MLIVEAGLAAAALMPAADRRAGTRAPTYEAHPASVVGRAQSSSRAT